LSTLATRIKILRKERDMTQEEFGKLFGIVKSTVSLYESGKSTPDDEIKKKIADYFDVTLDYLMGKSDIRNPYPTKPLPPKVPYRLERVDVPDQFETTGEAIQFILSQQSIMGYVGFDIDKLTDEQKIDFANELLGQLKMLSYKYKK